jgi:hypothetical protein
VAENNVTFSAMPTPTYDEFQTVSIWFGINASTGGSAITGHKEMSPDDARAFAAEITKACDIVEADK